MLVSIVIPCYNSQSTIAEVVDLCRKEISALPGYSCEFVLVNDYSKDGTFGEIRRLCETNSDVTGIDLAKNFGQHAAILAGLHYVKGDAVIGMDDDLQTHPSQIPKILKKAEEGYDVVFGHFKEKRAAASKQFFSRLSDFLLYHMVDTPKGITMNNFWFARRYVTDKIKEYRGSDAFVQLLLFRTTHNMANVELKHFDRAVGRSNYTFKKGLKQFLTAINYSIVPLRISSILGVLFSIIGLVSAVVVILQKLIRPNVQVGWSSLMCVILILFGFMFLILGIIGEYIGKTILTVNRTPLYVVRERVGANGPQKKDRV